MTYFARAVIDGLRFNKVRSLFTGAGVLIGVASVVLILALTSSFFANVAGNAGDRFTVGLSSSAEANLDVVEELRRPEMVARVDQLRRRTDLVSVESGRPASVVGVQMPDGSLVPDMRVAFSDDVAVTEGVGLGDAPGNVAVVHDNPEFDSGLRPGASLVVNGAVFSVVGLTSSLGEDGATRLFLPSRLAGVVSTDETSETASFTVVVADPAALETTRAAVLAQLNEGLDGRLKFIDYSAEEGRMLGEMLSSLSLFLGLIASISLAVAALNIVNVMYISTLERADEIAIYRSMGMTARGVQGLFILESVVVVSVFASLGVVMAHMVAWVILKLMRTPMVFSGGTMAVLLVVIVLIGVGGGMYPARRAAAIDPVRLLR